MFVTESTLDTRAHPSFVAFDTSRTQLQNMAHQNGINSSKKYLGLPGEEEYARRTYDKHFEELYSNDVNPESLYRAQVSTFARFAKIHPRWTSGMTAPLAQSFESLLKTFCTKLEHRTVNPSRRNYYPKRQYSSWTEYQSRRMWASGLYVGIWL
jgi:hypothetical protein